METNPQTKISSVWTKGYLELMGQLVHALHTISGETCHDRRMVGTGVGKTGHSYITITDSLNLSIDKRNVRLMVSKKNGKQVNRNVP